MKAAVFAVVALAFHVGIGGLKAADYGIAQQQTFRTATDVVIVDVSVRDGARLITGLGPDDFVVTDNGVRQTVEAVDAAAVPIDVTLIVDVSGNQRRPWTPRVDPARISHAIAGEVLQVTKILRETDRIRLLAIDSYVHQIWPLAPASTVRSMGRIEFDGLASVYDSIAAALMLPVEPARRHVVVARTKGRDSVSALDSRSLAALAERPDALFHLVLMETAADNEDDVNSFQGDSIKGMGLSWPTHRFWVPFRRQMITGNPIHAVTPEGQILKTGIQAGGGSWHQAELVNEPSLTGTFRQAFEDFRQSYVLRYTPRGVSRSGWHTIDVKVPKAKGATVSARRGYGIEEPKSAVPVAPLPAVPRTLAELTRAFEVGEYQRVVTGLSRVTDPARLMTEFEEAGNPWPAAPRQEAAFVIDLAEAGLFSPRNAVRDQAAALLARFATLVRHPLEPDAFERQWHFALLTLMQGTVRAATLDTFASRALARFPDESRFQLARAVAADQRAAASSGLGRTASPTPTGSANLQAARELYEGVLPFSDVALEARIRLAHLLHRMGQHDDALARLTEAGQSPIQDPALRYLHQLFRGHVLSALSRAEESIQAYRNALAQIPNAQSARVSLMNALFRQGERAEAATLAEQVQTESDRYTDPWWMYWQGQYRLFPQAMARLRQMAQMGTR